MMLRYPVVIDGEKGAHGIVFPDLPGAFAMGATVDEALADAEEMLPSCVRVLEAKGQKVPPPSAVEDVELQPWEMVAFVALRYPTAVEG